jgi:hypothetical protein
MLGEQLKILSELKPDFDLEAIGFEVPEIDLLIDGLNTIPEADPDDRLPEISESAISALGDLWQLGRHRVLCANSLLAVSGERLMDGAKADLVITDPPYNVVIDGHASGLGKIHHREFGMASGEMSSAEFIGCLRKAMLAARDHSHSGSLVLLHGLAAHDRDSVRRARSLHGAPGSLCLGEEQWRYGKLLSQRP